MTRSIRSDSTNRGGSPSSDRSSRSSLMTTSTGTSSPGAHDIFDDPVPNGVDEMTRLIVEGRSHAWTVECMASDTSSLTIAAGIRTTAERIIAESNHDEPDEVDQIEMLKALAREGSQTLESMPLGVGKCILKEVWTSLTRLRRRRHDYGMCTCAGVVVSAETPQCQVALPPGTLDGPDPDPSYEYTHMSLEEMREHCQAIVVLGGSEYPSQRALDATVAPVEVSRCIKATVGRVIAETGSELNYRRKVISQWQPVLDAESLEEVTMGALASLLYSAWETLVKTRMVNHTNGRCSHGITVDSETPECPFPAW